MISDVNKSRFGYSFLWVIYIYIELVVAGVGVIMLQDYRQISSPLCHVIKAAKEKKRGPDARLSVVPLRRGSGTAFFDLWFCT